MNFDFPQARKPRLSLHHLQSPHAGPISLTLAAGECVALVGASGTGKSVCLRMIADLDPCTGEILLDGVDRAAWSGPDWRRMVVYQAAEPACRSARPGDDPRPGGGTATATGRGDGHHPGDALA